MLVHLVSRGRQHDIGDWDQLQQEPIVELDLHLGIDETTHLEHMLKEYHE